ncbi:unnamed protein product [Polarella glacialis]|uniref:Uncharacterized protein n=1 Tax=Polarella glacialis TaxID=89957 RepID=A0A813HQQ2_POLGL|nr:unnamed protein product [Polarella glacialis]
MEWMLWDSIPWTVATLGKLEEARGSMRDMSRKKKDGVFYTAGQFNIDLSILVPVNSTLHYKIIVQDIVTLATAQASGSIPICSRIMFWRWGLPFGDERT